MNHQIVNLPSDAPRAGDVSAEAAETYIRAAQRRMAGDRRAALASLDDVFRSGRPPRSLDGRMRGEMLAVDIAPIVTPFVVLMQARYRFWLGKTLDAATGQGDNIMNAAARPWFRAFLPFYRGIRPDGATTFRALRFRAYVAPALMERDLPVLKIDYDVAGNPALTIRRVLDELVEVAGGYYLGRAYVRWWGGGWQRVAYFSLRLANEPPPAG